MTKEPEEKTAVLCSFCNKESIFKKKVGKKEMNICAICYAAYHIK